MSYATNEQYTVEDIYKMILEYRNNLLARNRLQKEYIDVIAGGNISQYGIESSMPKASGGTSDPTYNEINRLLRQDRVIDRFEKKVLYIQNRWDRIIERQDEMRAVIFNQALNGNSLTEITEITGYSYAKVRHNLLECAKLLQDGVIHK